MKDLFVTGYFLVNKLSAYCEIHVSCLKLMSHGKFICDWIFFSQ